VVFLGILMFCVINASAATYGNLTYSITNGEATITDCNTSASGTLVIPDTLGGYPVTTIGYGAFKDCTSLTSITIGNSVTSVGDHAFLYCKSLASITIPDSVTSIGNSAFYYCTSLTSITIPNSVISIGEDAFSLCTSLTMIYVDENNKNYCSDTTGVLFNKYKTELICYPAGKSGKQYSIPDSVASIGSFAFYYCTRLTSITIPDSVTSIGSFAFYYCTSLTSITIPGSVTSIEEGTFSSCYNLTNITIPNNVTSIGEGAFVACTSLTSIIIPDSVTSIGNSAFYYCESLTSINIPNNIISIEEDTFADCFNLASIIIPDSVTSIGNYAFSCTSLASITIPDSVTSIGNSAFYYCTSLKDVYYNGTENDWHNITIGDDNTSLTNATRHYFAHATFIDNSGNEFTKLTKNLGESIDINELALPDGYNAFFYQDAALTELYDLTTPITENVTIYVDFVKNSTNVGTKTVCVTANSGEKIFITIPDSLPEHAQIIFACYQNNRLIETQHAPNKNETVYFIVDSNFDSAKVFVWDSLSGMKPICDTEIVL